MSAVWNVVEDFKNVTKKKYFVVGCTTNPGDCDLFQKQVPTNVKVLYNPEFIAQGSIVSDLKRADMVLLGVDQEFENDSTVNDIRELYRRIQTTRAHRLYDEYKVGRDHEDRCQLKFLTTKISYANMLGDVLIEGCGDEITRSPWSVGADSRVGKKYLGWGLGYGGPCLPRDNRALTLSKGVGLEYNLGYVTDGFNNEHARSSVTTGIQ